MAKRKKATYELTIGEHPCQAKDPFTKEPLFDKDGKPVPGAPDWKTIRYNGRVIAYVTPSKVVSFIIPASQLGPIKAEAVKLAEKELKTVGHNVVLEPKKEVETDDES